jgi:WhiB family redox-sensing transcriptional regulator
MMTAISLTPKNWTLRAACQDQDPDDMFIPGTAQNRTKTVCQGCPVRVECLADALDSRMEYGVWGGMTERERRALLKRRPEIRDWAAFLTDARERWRASQELGS